MADGTFDVVLESDVMVTMRDGVRLATDIYRPARDGKPLEGPLPVLLMRTPYNKVARERGNGYNRHFARLGYAAVSQDCRGCYRSEGDVRFLIPEAEDGYDTLAWIAEQPWAGPKVGSWGTSWSGWTQTAMAALGPANLAVMIPNMSGANGYTSSVRHNGALELRFIAWAYWHSRLNYQQKLKAEPAVDRALRDAPPFTDWLTRWPIKPGQTQLRHVRPYEKWAMELMERRSFDEFWNHPSLNPSGYWKQFPDCPVFYVGGWYDSYTRASFENFTGHGAEKPGRVHLLMGPWTHGGATPEEPFAGDVEFGEDSALDSFLLWHQRIFDHYLKDKPMDEMPPLRLFVMGGGSGAKSAAGRLMHGGTWRDEYEWPLARTRFRDLHLHPGGVLSFDAPEDDHAFSEYRFDPADPVPSIGGNVSSLSRLPDAPASEDRDTPEAHELVQILAPGGFDQVEKSGVFGCAPPWLPLGSRHDVLVFETEVLEADVEVTGPVTVHLRVSTTGVDTDFTAKLIDVYPPGGDYPDGYRLNLSDSIVRLSSREVDGEPARVAPGEIIEIDIPLYPVSNLFVRGHKIRLDISSSNFPRFDVNTNTGNPFVAAAVINRVYHDKSHPSRITLPIVPSKK